MIKGVKIIECPRDAMQGIKTFIPTNQKIIYLQSLLNCGFDTLDFGSFVSPKAIPQMSDTAAVLAGLDLGNTPTKLLSIVANLRGAEAACSHDEITYLGYPFSISENFQMRNTHTTIKEAITVLQSILDIALKNDKKVVVYLSMGFGNPYGDPWSIKILMDWIELLVQKGIKIISLSDTIGTAKTNDIDQIFKTALIQYPEVEIGAHFHTKPENAFMKIKAAHDSGCFRFDAAIKGFGGCPMASDKLVGNMPTEKILSYLNTEKISNNVNSLRFESCYNQSIEIFNKFH